ncbi:MAG: PEGA domain-containing protein, partial [Alistipes sp.]|nr:PEGA domain-containing protein [Alistipes sp.]
TDSNMSCTISDVMIGNHSLKIVYGNLSREQSIDVNKNSILFRQTINIEESKPQFVVFVVEPQNAVVTIENNHYSLQDGAMQTVLNNGSYNYTVSAVGYHPQSGTFSVSGAKVEKIITLLADATTVTLTAPNNAEIWVNNEKKGSGEWSGTLTSGTYIFESRKDGHRTATISKQITSDKPQQNYALPAPEPIVGSVVVTSTPIMAEVALDGKPVGRTPLELNNILVGKHALVVSKEGYETKNQILSLIENKTETINITLSKTSSITKVQTVQRGSITSAPYKVGDYYNDGVKEGVVFEVSAGGKRGKIVSMTQSSEILQWSSDEYEQQRRIGAISETDGAYNMSKVKTIAGWQTKYPAFKWCADLGEGWYLPAIEELKIFTLKNSIHNAVNRTLAEKGGTKLKNRGEVGFYWSSTEDNSNICAWGVSMLNGYTFNYRKNYNRYVRAVAKF